MTIAVTPGVMQNVDPSKWKEHRYGLTPERWNRLQGKSFWITGAGTGYGRCMAVALAAVGASVFLTGRRRAKLLESLEEMKSLDVPTQHCHVVEADITDIEQIKRACSKVAGLCVSLYGLINNAAVPHKSSLQYESLEHWDLMMRTNVTAPWLLTREIFPHISKGDSLRVLCIPSEAGWAFTPGTGPYNVSKAALNNLAASMAEEYSTTFTDIDIQMNILSPGEARTEMNQGSPLSAYSVVSMALILLSHPDNGPNGKFFYRDGRHLQFTYAPPYGKLLM